MKILLSGDWHITEKQPKKRIDDYFRSQEKKLGWIIGLAIHEKCKYIIQPGDFFDSHKANDKLKRWVIKKLKLSNCPTIVTVFGQHDLRYHSSDTKNTPLRVLEAAGVVEILGEMKEYSPPINIYGASWYEDIPEPAHQDSPKKEINILVMHKMVVKNKKLWEGQEDARFGNIILGNHPFNLIVCGDNHQNFTISRNNRHLVNCGSLMRMTTAQLDHKPVVYVYDTEDKSLEEHFIPIEPEEKVFDLSKIEREAKENKELESFVKYLKEDTKLEGLDFAKNLKEYLEKNDVEQETLNIIEEVMR